MAKKITTEEESNLRRQARRRLIGAVALVLAIVVFLPMVFDDEPSLNTANEIELRIPNKETAPPLAVQPVVAPVTEAVVTSAVTPAPVVEAVSAPAPVSAVSAAPVALVVKAEAKPDAKPKVEAQPKADVKPAAKSTPKTGWVVQVGAYSNVDTAKQMYAKLSKEGFHVYTEKVGNMVRVRVGSYPTREAADKIKLKLEKIGLHPNVVNLE